MPEISDFHDATFPTDIGLGSSGGPQRNTEIVTLGSGREQRNQRWSQSRGRFEAGYGIKSLEKLQEVVAFYEARRGPLYGFRFKDPFDWKSCPPKDQVSGDDQQLGTGDGQRTSFQLTKTYGGSEAPYVRQITKPVLGSVIVKIGGVEQVVGADFTLDAHTGLVEFATAPEQDAVVSGGFEFDIPVRFESDQLTVNLSAFSAGDIPNIPLIEVCV